MALNIGGINVQTRLNASPRTGTPIPKMGTSAAKFVPGGNLPKRSRGGGAGDPLGSIPAPIREAFGRLKAPTVAFRVKGTETPAEAVLSTDHAVKLTPRISGDGVSFYTQTVDEEGKHLSWDAVDDDEVLFTAGEDLYTAEGVEMGEVMDNFPVEGNPEELNKLYQAMQKFNKATGKTLRMLLDHNVYDDKGINILKQVKVIWRVS